MSVGVCECVFATSEYQGNSLELPSPLSAFLYLTFYYSVLDSPHPV